MRKFKVIKKYENLDIALPVRSTEKSAGYDLAAAEDVVVPSIFKKNEEGELPKMKGTLIPTGVKAYCEDNEYVALHARSSLLERVLLAASSNLAPQHSSWFFNERDFGCKRVRNGFCTVNQGGFGILVGNSDDARLPFHSEILYKGYNAWFC